MSIEDSGSPPRSWHEADQQLPLGMPDLTHGPQGPFFVRQDVGELDSSALMAIAKNEADPQQAVQQIMRELDMLPDDDESLATLEAALKAAATVYHDTYLSLSGYATSEHRQKLGELRQRTKTYEDRPLLKSTAGMLQLFPGRRNTEADALVRILFEYEFASNS